MHIQFSLLILLWSISNARYIVSNSCSGKCDVGTYNSSRNPRHAVALTTEASTGGFDTIASRQSKSYFSEIVDSLLMWLGKYIIYN